MIDNSKNENTNISFYGESKRISRPENYEKLLEKIQEMFAFNPSHMSGLKFYYLNGQNEPIKIITSKNYKKISELAPQLEIKIEFGDEGGIGLAENEEEDPVLDKNEKNEIMEKIIEDTKQRIQAKNLEIITQSGLMEPSISNDLEESIVQKLNNLNQEMVKLSEATISKFTKELELRKKEESEFKSQKKEKKEEELSEHNAICNGCNCQKIKGIRYKCVTCPSFNYCEKCESKIDEDNNFFHEHPFYMLKHPIQELM